MPLLSPPLRLRGYIVIMKATDSLMAKFNFLATKARRLKEARRIISNTQFSE